MNSDANNMITEILGCNEFEASMITEILACNNITTIEGISKDSSKEDNSLIVVSEGITYAIGVDLKYGVYSIKDSATDKYLYAVYQ